jgi:hypothetical protein
MGVYELSPNTRAQTFGPNLIREPLRGERFHEKGFVSLAVPIVAERFASMRKGNIKPIE